MQIAQSVTIEIPDIDEMSDDDLERLAHENDGRWSSQTKALLKQFNTQKLDLNLPWAKTRTWWQCPSCNRGKPSIARLSGKGVLRCKLENHHDHLGDLAGSIFDEQNPWELNKPDYNLQRDVARSAILDLTIRFPKALICSDCNSAEAEAKKHVFGINKYFTFTPGEISTFISSVPNKKHVLDLDTASQRWQEARADFEDRIDYAERMARRFRNGKNRQETVWVQPDLSFKDNVYLVSAIAQSPVGMPTLQAKIEQRSVSRDGDGEFSVSEPNRTSRAPSDAEFRGLEKHLCTSKDYWLGLGELWKCECCHRDKRQICRISNRKEWTARIHKIYQWDLETEHENLAWRNRDAESPLVLKIHKATYICQDCRKAITNLTKLYPAISVEHVVLGEMSASFAEVSPNRDHKVDFEKAFQFAAQNHDLAVAVSDYHRHKERSLNAEYEFKQKTQYLRISPAAAFEAISAKLCERGIASSQDKTDYAEWLVAQGMLYRKVIAAEKSVREHGLDLANTQTFL